MLSGGHPFKDVVLMSKAIPDSRPVIPSRSKMSRVTNIGVILAELDSSGIAS